MSVKSKLLHCAILSAMVVPEAVRAGDDRPVAAFRAEEVVINSRAVARPACLPQKPLVPDLARVMEITGTVLVEYTVHADGTVGEVSLAKSSAHPVLAEAVEKWLGGCAFEPRVANGKPVSQRLIQPFNFKTRG